MKRSKLFFTAAVLLTAASLSACNLPLGLSGATPTADAQSAAQTVAAVQTRSGPNIAATGEARQTPVGFSSPTPIDLTNTPEFNVTQGPCENRADFIDDVTVPDNTKFDPGDSFIKIWRLRNSGDCSWSPSYLLTFIGGDRLSAPNTVQISTQVLPGNLIDLAVDMTAPNDPDTYQGFWKLRSPDGEFFGIGPRGDQSFWVKILVPSPPTSEATITPTASMTSTPTPTHTGTVTLTVTPTGSASPEATLTPTATFTPTPAP